MTIILSSSFYYSKNESSNRMRVFISLIFQCIDDDDDYVEMRCLSEAIETF